MLAKPILEFLSRHEGLQVGFKIATYFEDHVIICFADPWKNLSFDYTMSKIEMNNDVFIKFIVDKAEKEMYGEKEEHNEQ